MSEILCERCKWRIARFKCLFCNPNHYFCMECDRGGGCLMVDHLRLSGLPQGTPFTEAPHEEAEPSHHRAYSKL